LREVQAARACLEALPEMQEAIAICQKRKARCMTWKGNLLTVNAWNYGSTGKALSLLLDSWKLRIKDVSEAGGIFNGPHFARVSCLPPHGVDFFSQRDVFLIRPVPRRIMKPSFDERLLFVKQGGLLVGSHGQLNEGSIFGQVAMVTQEQAHAAFTQDILRIYIGEEYRQLAFAFLSTQVGMRLLRSTAFRASSKSALS
jgi:hypothetical protein